MGKFKVGDKVRVKKVEVGTTSDGYTFVRWMTKYIGKKFTIETDCDAGGYTLKEGAYFWAEDWLEPAKPETIVIYRDGDKTVALDKTTGKKAEAKCSKEDTYDFYTGAKIAFERLIGEDKAEEKPKTKLKPCPFCGANAVIMGKRAVYIMCGNYRCMARTDKYTTVEFAKEVWNRRVSDEKIDNT